MGTVSNTHATRESWLVAAIQAVKPWLAEAAAPVPDKVRVTMGFPSSRALSTKHRRIGECWPPEASSDGTVEIHISPVLDNPLEVLATLVHELGHAALGNSIGHKAPFAKLMKKLLLEGKPTATTAGSAFTAKAETVLAALGPLGHAAVHGTNGRKPQTTRMIKCECGTCGYVARTTQKWISDAGAPICPTD